MLQQSLRSGSRKVSVNLSCTNPSARRSNCFPRQLVHLRRLDQSIAGIAQSIPSLVIRQDKDDIGRAALGLSRKLESKQYQEYAQDAYFHFIISYNEKQFCY